MGRMKSHWPEQVNPSMELRSAKNWLEMRLTQDRGGSLLPPDVYRMFSLVEAITIIDNALDQLKLEAHNAEMQRRKEYEAQLDTSTAAEIPGGATETGRSRS